MTAVDCGESTTAGGGGFLSVINRQLMPVDSVTAQT